MKLLSSLLLMIFAFTNVNADTDCQSLYTNGSALAEPAECANFNAPKKSAINIPTAKNAVTDTATFFDIGFISDNFGTHPMGDLSNQTIANAALAEAYFAMDYDASATTLYAFDSNANNLVTLNADGTIASVIGFFSGLVGGENISGLTISSSNTCYVSATDGTNSSLYTCDLTTGALTLIGTQNTTPLLIAIEVGCDGIIYGHDIGTDSFYTLNPTDGSATLLGAHGLAANFAQDMTMDHEAGVLYAYIYTGGGTNTYASVNTTTGAITALNVDNPQGEFTGASQTICNAPLAPPTPVPTLSLWSILSLLLLIGSITLWRFKRT